jgi:SAM-dependent methyltransferase
MASPASYEAWYHTPRGRWIGQAEYDLLRSLLSPAPGAALLDIGCGTGYFTRRFAREAAGPVVGLDPDRAWLDYAREQTAHGEQYVAGRAEALPFTDASFDYAVAVTAFCFVGDPQQALRELARVTRRRFVLGLLNRRSLLYLQKGRRGGSGGYRGAHWHTPAEARALLQAIPVVNTQVRSAIVMPGGHGLARAVEAGTPRALPLGGFLAVAADLHVPDRR